MPVAPVDAGSVVSPPGAGQLLARPLPSPLWGKVVPPPPISGYPGADAPLPGVAPPVQFGPRIGCRHDPLALEDRMAALRRALLGGLHHSLEIPLPDVYPPPGSIDLIAAFVDITVPAGGAVTFMGNLNSIPAGSVAIIRSIGVTVQSAATATAALAFWITANGVQLPGSLAYWFYQGIATGGPRIVYDKHIRLLGGTALAAYVQSVDGGAYTAAIDAEGWVMSARLARNWLEGRSKLMDGV